MRQWLDTAHVKAWWPDAERHAALMLQDMDNPQIDMRLVALNDHPFAYIHDHDARSFGLVEYADLPTGARVVATFVGDRAFMGQGHSAAYIDARTRALRVNYPMIAVGPSTTDTQAISVYAQARFLKRRIAPTGSGRLVQVMTRI
jgi:aminoglycoside 6'-N-acetyltransferase